MSIPLVKKTLTGTSPAAAGTAALAATVAGLDAFDSFVIEADLVGATGGVLDVYLQSSWDGGTTFYDYAHFPQLAAGGAAVHYKISPALDSTIYAVGTGTSPTIAANTCVGGHPGGIMRVLCVAGSSTSAGAAVTVNVFCFNARR